MIWLDFDFDAIRHRCEKVGGRYKLTLGSPIEVTTTKRRHINNILSALSPNCLEDKFMLRYRANNVIYFDEDFLDGDESEASVNIDAVTSEITIGKVSKYSERWGILAFSHSLALSGKANDEIKILVNTQTSKSNLFQKVKLLGVGCDNDKLFGLFLLPVVRGVALWGNGIAPNMGVTVRGRALRDCTKWTPYTIDDWFCGCKVEVE